MKDMLILGEEVEQNELLHTISRYVFRVQSVCSYQE